MINYLTILMAQPQEGSSPMSTLILFGSIILIFYFMIIRPQQKRAKERQRLLDSVKKGDKVLTSGGIYGSVVGIDNNILLVQIADNVKVKVDKNSIATIIPDAGTEVK